MLTSADRSTFQKHGLIRCEGFLPMHKVAAAQAAIWQWFSQMGVRQDETWLLETSEPLALAHLGKQVTNAFKRHQVLIDLVADEIPQVVSALLDGRATWPMTDYPQLLFTWPNATSWMLPHNVWHLDLPRLPERGIPGVQIFTFLDRVVPGGGGTLVVAGSHHLLNEGKPISSQQLKRRLKQEPYFRKLMTEAGDDRHRFLEQPGRAGNVELQVVELYGERGDVYFMDLRLLHTVSPNATATPRIMLTQRYLLESAYRALYGKNKPTLSPMQYEEPNDRTLS